MNDNDANDPAPFIQLAAITANVTRFLLSKRDKQAHEESDQSQRKTDQRAKAETQRRELCVGGRKFPRGGTGVLALSGSG